MDQEFEQELRRQLDALQMRGDRHLRADARRQGLAVARRWTTRAAPAAALACLALTLGSRIGPLTLWLSCGAMLLAVFVAGSALQRRRHVTRQAALALFDARPGSKDRIVASDEFVALPLRDGFRDAALEEARPWLDRALTAEIAAPPAAARSTRDWPCLVVAVAVLLIATLVQEARRPAHAPAGIVGGTHTLLAAIGVRPVLAGRDGSDDAAGDGTRAGRADDPAAPAGGGADGGMARPASPSGRTMAEAGASGGPGLAGASHAAPVQESAAVPGDPSASSARTPAGRGGAGGTGGAAGAERDAADLPAPVDGAGAGAQAPGSPAPGSQRAPGTPSSTAAGARASTTPPRGTQAAGSGVQRAGGRPQPSDGEEPQPGGSSSSERGEGGSANAGTGQDALKRSRGASGLLLAVPADDRLVGTANAGPVASTRRPAMPQPWRSAPVTAESRGRQRGDAGRVLHRPATSHEDRVTRAFFRRQGMTPADARAAQ